MSIMKFRNPATKRQLRKKVQDSQIQVTDFARESSNEEIVAETPTEKRRDI